MLKEFRFSTSFSSIIEVSTTHYCQTKSDNSSPSWLPSYKYHLYSSFLFLTHLSSLRSCVCLINKSQPHPHPPVLSIGLNNPSSPTHQSYPSSMPHSDYYTRLCTTRWEHQEMSLIQVKGIKKRQLDQERP